MASASSSRPSIKSYEFQEKLGAGNYATVFKAIRKDDKEIVAIKVVEQNSLSKTFVDNILTEISLLKRMKHPNIIDMLDFLWDDKKIYIIMELANAGSLSLYIKKRTVLPESTCRLFLRQLADAMKYLRSNNVSHFDLKPQNLLLHKTQSTGKSSIYTLKIADFGFAQHLCLGEENHCVKGSPLYMAPEILLKHRYEASADLWSIGVILYECLFGKAPYSSKTLQELLDKIKNLQKIETPKHSKISVECEDLLKRLLQHDPSKRISFEDFFDHDFIDLKHAPNDENFEIALQLVTEAVEEDTKQNYDQAYYLYCESLQYFVPLIEAETDATKKVALRSRTQTYLNRAEEIKHSLLQQQHVNSTAAPVNRATVKEVIQQALTPSHRYSQLHQQCSSSPQLRAGLEIGRKAELYLYEKRLDIALEGFTNSLSVLVPLLAVEPKGPRKDLLHQQITVWMKDGESIKAMQITKENMSKKSAPSGSSSSCNIA